VMTNLDTRCVSAEFQGGRTGPREAAVNTPEFDEHRIYRVPICFIGTFAESRPNDNTLKLQALLPHI